MVRRGVDFPGGSRLSSLAFRGKRQDGKPATTLFSSLRLTPLRLAPDTARMKVFFRRLARHRPPLTVTLYTRAGCHLCDDAKKPAARAVAATPGATLRIVDIAGQPEYEARYGQRIPVVAVAVDGGETVIAEGKISDLRVRRALGALIEGA
jgi:glutaredoxin-like protein DUF836